MNDLNRPQEKEEEKTSALSDDSPIFPPEKKQAGPKEHQLKFLKKEDDPALYEKIKECQQELETKFDVKIIFIDDQITLSGHHGRVKHAKQLLRKTLNDHP